MPDHQQTGAYTLGAFPSWEAAHLNAARAATATGLDVAIRRRREFGRTVFRVSFACHMDSDYALAEIVRPGEPA